MNKSIEEINVRRQTFVVLITFLALACSRESNLSTDPKMIEAHPDLARIEIRNAEPQSERPALVDDPNYVPGSRKAEEEAALNELLKSYPPSTHKVLLQSLDPTSHVRLASIGNSEQVTLYNTVASIRAADIAAERRAASRMFARSHPLVVTVALVDPSVVSPASARVLRDPNKAHSDIILLGDNATSEDVAVGFALLNVTRQQHGDQLLHPIFVGAERPRLVLSPQQRSFAEGLLRSLQRQPKQQLESFRQARSVRVKMPPLSS
jgi:hypothetical protein